MDQINPKRILVKARMKPEIICGRTSKGARSKVAPVTDVNR
jgi:hypothetical protein